MNARAGFGQYSNNEKGRLFSRPRFVRELQDA
jgi:hypothetical protein